MVDVTAVDPRTTVAYRLGTVIEDLETARTALTGWYELRGLDSAEPRHLSYDAGRALDCLWAETLETIETRIGRLQAILDGDANPVTSAD